MLNGFAGCSFLDAIFYIRGVLSYMAHSGGWFVSAKSLPLDDCFCVGRCVLFCSTGQFPIGIFLSGEKGSELLRNGIPRRLFCKLTSLRFGGFAKGIFMCSGRSFFRGGMVLGGCLGGHWVWFVGFWRVDWFSGRYFLDARMYVEERPCF